MKHYLLILLLTLPLYGQDVSFTLQTWATVSKMETAQTGVGIRRARIRGKFGEGNVSAFVQYGMASGKLHDARVDVKFDKYTVRVGRFVVPGNQSGGQTSHTALDFCERSIVGRMYSIEMDRPDHRSYGVSVIGNYGVFNYEVMASNPENIKPYNINHSVVNPSTKLDYMAYIKTGNLSSGVHYNSVSITGYAYLENDRFRGKVDVVHTDLSKGYRVLAFWKLSRFEIGAQYETWNELRDITAGANFTLNAKSKLKVAATFMEKQTIFHVMLQLKS